MTVSIEATMDKVRGSPRSPSGRGWGELPPLPLRPSGRQHCGLSAGLLRLRLRELLLPRRRGDHVMIRRRAHFRRAE